VGTTCFLLSFSCIIRHLHGHFFYSHVILHTVHPSFLLKDILCLFSSTYCIVCAVVYGYLHSWIYERLYKPAMKTLRHAKQNVCWQGSIFGLWSTSRHNGHCTRSLMPPADILCISKEFIIKHICHKCRNLLAYIYRLHSRDVHWFSNLVGNAYLTNHTQ
jgi:hypothetical protein